ncbi:MAG: toll/interleukin-1 receptor domain-containing protein, partial [Anaerolineae bacterium]|nr:toll/interleukin-1 receptor domain-containing protein [Anaerolineae bacterium]
MVDVFISYSRRDEDFVRRLHDALANVKRDVWVDWEDIPLTADWWREIQTGIEAADTFMFVISPDSARSEVCYNEVDYASKNNKRIVPVVYRSPSREEQQKMHPAVNRHNWVFIHDDDRFEGDFKSLIAALDTNLAYVRDHTRLLVRAKEWEQRDRDDSLVLRGRDLQEAENMLVRSSHIESLKPTDLQTEYVFASRRAANRRQSATLGSVILGLIVAIGLAVVAFLSFRQAEANLLLSQQTQSLFLADLSQQEQEAGHYRVALLLALESLKNFPTVVNGESNRALLDSLTGPAHKLIALHHDVGPVSGVRWNQDETRILTVAGNDVLIWDANGGDVLLTLHHDEAARGGLWNQDSSRLLTWSADGTARLWDPFIENELLRLPHDGPVNGAMWIENGTRILTWSDDGFVRIWDGTSAAPL